MPASSTAWTCRSTAAAAPPAARARSSNWPSDVGWVRRVANPTAPLGLRHVGFALTRTQPTVRLAFRQCPAQERQALIHAVVDRGVVVRELLVAMRHAQPLQRAVQAAGAIDQVELVDVAAV